MTQQDERRSHPRSKRGFQVVDASDDNLITHVDNISCSGVRCHTRRPLAEMTKMEIVLELPAPDKRRVMAEGVVVRCDVEESDHGAFRVAILYTKVAESDFDAIQSYVEHDLDQ
jgi:hypothetical protein